MYKAEIKIVQKKLGKKIKNTRTEKRITQEKLAEKVGINREHMSNIETGKKFPSLSMLITLSFVLDIELYELFDFSREY